MDRGALESSTVKTLKEHPKDASLAKIIQRDRTTMCCNVFTIFLDVHQ